MACEFVAIHTTTKGCLNCRVLAVLRAARILICICGLIDNVQVGAQQGEE